MSRCFPYVQCAMESGCGGEGSLIEPIEKVREKAQNNDKKKHKEKSKENKHREKKQKHKEEKERPREFHCGKKRSHDESFPSTSHKDCGSVEGDVWEVLERSGLTEEHGPPSCRGNPYDSDKSQNSSKRLKTSVTTPITSASVASHSSNGHRRFLLKLKKSADSVVSCQLKESESHGVRDMPTASSLTKITVTQEAPVLFNRDAGHMEQKPAQTVAEPCFSGRTDAAGIEKHLEQPPVADAQYEAVSQRRHRRSRAEKTEMRYGSLTAKWLPPPLAFELSDSGDESWLYGVRGPAARPPLPKPCGADAGALTDIATSTGSGFQPRARYLAEIDAYAMPYVIPF